MAKFSEKKVEIFHPSCNVDTVRDGRGGIFTWVPPDKIAEFNMLYFTPGASRGHHHHPEFVEYSLIVEGSGIVVAKDGPSKKERVIHVSKGTCIRTPKGVTHTIYAITPLTVIAMLTKPWDDCTTPIIREENIIREKNILKEENNK